MIYKDKKTKLKNGQEILFRAPKIEDAEELLEYLKVTTMETNFLLRAPEECEQDIVREELFVANSLNSNNQWMIIVEISGKIAGTAQITIFNRKKTKHRGTIGIALYKRYWNLGIGTLFFEELFEIARQNNVLQLELDFLEGNKRGQALYEKMGFKIYAEHPKAIRLPDGTYLKEYSMLKEL